MRAVVKAGAEGGLASVRVGEVPDPVAGPGEVVVAPGYVGLCHTDVAMAHGESSVRAAYRPAYPLVLGHEFVGTVASVGEGVGGALRAGQRVVGSAHVTCQQCRWCRTGRSMLCPRLRVLGLDRDGVLAQRCALPAVNLVPVPDAMSDRLAALAEPFAVAAHAVDLAGQGGAEPPGEVAVVGPGSVGLLVTGLLASAASVTVVGTARDTEQLRIARRLGAHADASTADTVADAAFDAVIETAGSPAAVRTALRLCRPGGRVVCVGLPSEPTRVDTAGLARAELSLVGSRAYDLSTWSSVPQRLAAAPQLEMLVSQVLPMSRFTEALELVHSRAATKVLLDPT